MRTLLRATGTSQLGDAAAAGAAAAAAALAALGGEPTLVLVYASVRYDLPRLLEGVRSVTGAAPLAGGTSSGHFAGAEHVPPGLGVAVLLLGGDRYRFGVGSAEGMADAPVECGVSLAAAAREAAGDDPELPHAALLLLVDGMGGDSQQVVKGVHRVAGAAVPVVGGATGDDRRMRDCSVFHGAQVLANGAVGVWIASGEPLAVAVEHGWSPVSGPELVTRADGLRVEEIGGRPAAEVYGEHAVLGEVGAELVAGDGSQASFALGVLEPTGGHAVRGVYPVGGGALMSFTALEEYCAVQVVTADPRSVLEVVPAVVDRATGTREDPGVLLGFDCIGRADILGDLVVEEVAAMARAARGAVLFGLYGYGEIARWRGVGGVHNATLCALVL